MRQCRGDETTNVEIKVEPSEDGDARTEQSTLSVSPNMPNLTKYDQVRTNNDNNVNNESSYKCSFCPYRNHNKKYLEYHLKLHTDSETGFKCTHCNYICTRKDLLMRHVQMHSATTTATSTVVENMPRLNKFNQVGESRPSIVDPYNTNKSIQKQKKSHDVMVYKCTKCMFSATTWKSLFGHISRKHRTINKKIRGNLFKMYQKLDMNVNDDNSTMPILKSFHVFNNNNQFTTNSKAFNGRKYTEYKCSECSFVCTNKKLLVQHLKAKEQRHYRQQKLSRQSTTKTSIIKSTAPPNLDNVIIDDDRNNHAILDPKKDFLQCKQCAFQSVRYATLVRHMKTRHNIKCDERDMKFQLRSTEKLNRVENQKLRCNICDFTTFRHYSLLRHMDKMHSNSNENKCTVNKSTTVALKGKQVETGTTPVAVEDMPVLQPYEVKQKGNNATITGSINNKKRKYATIMNNESDNNQNSKCQFKCEQCPYESRSNIFLSRHKKLHSGQQQAKHICNNCSFLTNRKITLHNHLKMFHSDSIKLQSNNMKDDEILSNRLQTQSNEEIGPPNLLRESNRDNTPPNIMKNDEVKTARSGYNGLKCHVCPYEVRRKDYLAKHHMLHTGEKVSKTFCDRCNFITISKCSLITHRNRYHVNTTDDLNIPKLTMVDNEDNNVGKKSKSNIINPCAICPYVHCNSVFFEKHQKLHSGEIRARYRCTQCQFLTMTSNTLRHHIKKFHEANIKVT